jgi:hypothetical protein
MEALNTYVKLSEEALGKINANERTTPFPDSEFINIA